MLILASTEGEVQVILDGKKLVKLGVGKMFGELAVLYNCTRSAHVKALTDTKVYPVLKNNTHPSLRRKK